MEEQPKLKTRRASQCKLCNLLKWDRGLWIDVHKRVLEEKMSYTVVLNWLNMKIDTMNASRSEPLPHFNAVNFSLHFSKHVGDFDKFQSELKKSVTTRVKAETNDDLIANAVVSDMRHNEHAKVDFMLSLMENNLESYAKALAEKQKAGKIPSIRELEMYSKVVSDLINAKQNLLKLKSDTKVTSDAVNSAIELVVTGLATRIVSVAEEVRAMLQGEFQPESSYPEQIHNLIKVRLSSDMRNLVKDTLEKVSKTYGIK